MILLSVDWDMFVPEDPMWDISHQESLLFQTILWSHRYNLRDIMRTTGQEHDFWHHVTDHFKYHADIQRTVSDSHIYGYQAAQGCEGVVMFDAHHDCWDTQHGNLVHCDNWLRTWLREVPTRWAVWVYPEHAERIGAPDFPEDMDSQLTAVKWEDFLKDSSLIPRHEAVGAVHVCRSGCWTPPWLDDSFIDFFSEGNSPEDYSIAGDWNPLIRRWDANQESQARAMLESQAEMMRNLQNPESLPQ